MDSAELRTKIRLLCEMQRVADEALAEVAALKDEIKAHMGASSEMRVGEYKITWKSITTSRIDTAALKKAVPDLAERFTVEYTTRRFNIGI